jgi:hypothetical protein
MKSVFIDKTEHITSEFNIEGLFKSFERVEGKVTEIILLGKKGGIRRIILR